MVDYVDKPKNPYKCSVVAYGGNMVEIIGVAAYGLAQHLPWQDALWQKFDNIEVNATQFIKDFIF